MMYTKKIKNSKITTKIKKKTKKEEKRENADVLRFPTNALRLKKKTWTSIYFYY